MSGDLHGVALMIVYRSWQSNMKVILEWTLHKLLRWSSLGWRLTPWCERWIALTRRAPVNPLIPFAHLLQALPVYLMTWVPCTYVSLTIKSDISQESMLLRAAKLEINVEQKSELLVWGIVLVSTRVPEFQFYSRLETVANMLIARKF